MHICKFFFHKSHEYSCGFSKKFGRIFEMHLDTFGISVHFAMVAAYILSFTFVRRAFHWYIPERALAKRILDIALFSAIIVFGMKIPLDFTNGIILPLAVFTVGPWGGMVVLASVLACTQIPENGTLALSFALPSSLYLIGLLFYRFRATVMEHAKLWGFLLLSVSSCLATLILKLASYPAETSYQIWSAAPLECCITIFGTVLYGYALLTQQARTAMANQIRERKELLDTLLEASTDGFMLIENGRITEINRQMLAILDATRESVIGQSPMHFSPTEQMHGELSIAFGTKLLDKAQREGSIKFEWLHRSSHDRITETEVVLFRIPGKKNTLAAFVRDISERRSAESFLALSAAVFETSREALMITNAIPSILFVNQAFTALTGYESDEVIGKNPNILRSHHHDDSFFKEMWNHLHQDGYWEGEIWDRRKSGDNAPLRLKITRQCTQTGITSHYIGVYTDIAKIAKSEEVLSQVSLFDPLTGLESRIGFMLRLQHLLETMERPNHSIAVVAIDISNFKSINNSYGHLTGDQVLKTFGERLRMLETTHCHFARLGGDEFLVSLHQEGAEIQLQQFLDAMVKIVKTPIVLGGEPLFLAMSIGVAIADLDTNSDGLVKQADMALNQAKQNKTPFVIFDSAMQNLAMHNLILTRKLKLAIENNQMEVFYQPKINIRTGAISGMEALSRWRDENGKFIPPVVFIPLAEKNGLINLLFQKMVGVTVKDMATLFLPQQKDLMVSINLSVHQFEIEHLVQQIVARVDHAGVPHEHFEFEVTEGVFIANIEKTRHTLMEFKDQGFQLSLDDFGTGYSSLTYLRHLPFDTLKIDKSFMDPVPEDLRQNNLTESIVTLSRSIGLKCVAEGVETTPQLDFLRGLDCEFYQGYLFSPPVDRNAFLALLKKHSA
jgi:diguanylate cyclase (GGDEF)-like protein/PAS domain S-box-containing protein